jgi:aspartate aminotransferase-like enzyme
MFQVGPYIFKRAETDQEFEQIHCLNYCTFVSEIPQHPDPGNGHLVDKFHDKNSYFIVVRDGQVVGMISGHDQPPFSVADRLANPEILHRPGTRPLEARLLAVRPELRNGMVFFGLLWTIYDYAQANGYTHLYMSGLEERVPMYRRLGFESLGPPVPCGQAAFVPMVLTVGQLPAQLLRVKRLWENHVERESGRIWHDGHAPRSTLHAPRFQAPHRQICLLPGPVTTSQAVHDAFHQPPIYHRGPEFIGLFRKVRHTLGDMVGGRDVALFNGSGTLANEAVAAALAADQLPGRGLLLVNGEFGNRLARQATRFGLNPRLLSWPWGQPWDLDQIETALADEPAGSWVWGVHQESSTGVLNDLPGLVRVARRRGIRVCMDCISSLGAMPLDLRDVYLATGATGKSLGSYAGLAIVFANTARLAQLDTSRVPSYLDIPAALASEGPRYTFPSPTVSALEAALADYTTPDKARARYEQYANLGAYVRAQLRSLDLKPLATEPWACPVVTTFAPPAGESSRDFVARCQSWGFAIGGQSQYLAERRLVQIATMGAVAHDDCARLFRHLALGQRPAFSPAQGLGLLTARIPRP